MRYRSARLAWLAITSACCLTATLAAQPPEQPPVEPPKVATFAGVIHTLDAQNRTLEVRAAVFTKQFAAAPDCEVVIKDKPKANLADLKVGDQVNVTYQEVAGALVAHRIEQFSTPPVARP